MVPELSALSYEVGKTRTYLGTVGELYKHADSMMVKTFRWMTKRRWIKRLVDFMCLVKSKSYVK